MKHQLISKLRDVYGANLYHSKQHLQDNFLCVFVQYHVFGETSPISLWWYHVRTTIFAFVALQRFDLGRINTTYVDCTYHNYDYNTLIFKINSTESHVFLERMFEFSDFVWKTNLMRKMLILSIVDVVVVEKEKESDSPATPLHVRIININPHTTPYPKREIISASKGFNFTLQNPKTYLFPLNNSTNHNFMASSEDQTAATKFDSMPSSSFIQSWYEYVLAHYWLAYTWILLIALD